MQQSILAFRKRRYLWVASLLVAVTAAAYWLQDPQEPPNGGTVLGYTLGGMATALILWLTWFGVRKRRYHSTSGSVQGWLSAHVYLGLTLIVIATLHAGFQFGLNVHTLAYVIMMLVIASGAFGVYAYLRYPLQLSKNRDGTSRAELLDELQDLDNRALRIATGLGSDYQLLVASGIRRTQLGGALMARLRGQDHSQVELPGTADTTPVANPGQETILDWLAERQSRESDAALAARIGELSALLRNKRGLLKKLADDLRMQAILEIWLYVHVPLTFALLAAVAAHIFVVFLYW